MRSLEEAQAALPNLHGPEAARIELQIGQLHYRRGEFEPARVALSTAVETVAETNSDANPGCRRRSRGGVLPGDEAVRA